jgi:hypothetical protein
MLFERLKRMGEDTETAWLTSGEMCYKKTSMSPELHRRFVLEFRTALNPQQVEKILEVG